MNKYNTKEAYNKLVNAFYIAFETAKKAGVDLTKLQWHDPAIFNKYYAVDVFEYVGDIEFREKVVVEVPYNKTLKEVLVETALEFTRDYGIAEIDISKILQKNATLNTEECYFKKDLVIAEEDNKILSIEVYGITSSIELRNVKETTKNMYECYIDLHNI